jgi:hypothetical protein
MKSWTVYAKRYIIKLVHRFVQKKKFIVASPVCKLQFVQLCSRGDDVEPSMAAGGPAMVASAGKSSAPTQGHGATSPILVESDTNAE